MAWLRSILEEKLVNQLISQSFIQTIHQSINESQLYCKLSCVKHKKSVIFSRFLFISEHNRRDIGQYKC